MSLMLIRDPEGCIPPRLNLARRLAPIELLRISGFQLARVAIRLCPFPAPSCHFSSWSPCGDVPSPSCLGGYSGAFWGHNPGFQAAGRHWRRVGHEARRHQAWSILLCRHHRTRRGIASHPWSCGKTVHRWRIVGAEPAVGRRWRRDGRAARPGVRPRHRVCSSHGSLALLVPCRPTHGIVHDLCCRRHCTGYKGASCRGWIRGTSRHESSASRPA